MNFTAVITGDIVDSRKINKHDFSKILYIIKKTIDEFNLRNENIVPEFEIFRGDSFQGVVRNPKESLRLMIILRTALISLNKLHEKENINSHRQKLKISADARIATGISINNSSNNKLIESMEEAPVISGMLLDKLKNNNERLGIVTGSGELNKELEVQCKLADAIISRWSSQTAEAVYFTLQKKLNQRELSELLGITQPAVHKRLVSVGKFNAIESFLERFEDIIKNYTKNGKQ